MLHEMLDESKVLCLLLNQWSKHVTFKRPLEDSPQSEVPLITHFTSLSLYSIPSSSFRPPLSVSHLPPLFIFIPLGAPCYLISLPRGNTAPLFTPECHGEADAETRGSPGRVCSATLWAVFQASGGNEFLWIVHLWTTLTLSHTFSKQRSYATLGQKFRRGKVSSFEFVTWQKEQE